MNININHATTKASANQKELTVGVDNDVVASTPMIITCALDESSWAFGVNTDDATNAGRIANFQLKTSSDITFTPATLTPSSTPILSSTATDAPTTAPTNQPTYSPTQTPTNTPTQSPTETPTAEPDTSLFTASVVMVSMGTISIVLALLAAVMMIFIISIVCCLHGFPLFNTKARHDKVYRSAQKELESATNDIKEKQSPTTTAGPTQTFQPDHLILQAETDAELGDIEDRNAAHHEALEARRRNVLKRKLEKRQMQLRRSSDGATASLSGSNPMNAPPINGIGGQERGAAESSLLGDTTNPMFQASKMNQIKILPAGWTEEIDKDGTLFYHNDKLDKTTWAHPADVAVHKHDPTLPDGWEAHHNADGSVFYANEATGQKSWDHPAGLDDDLVGLTEDLPPQWSAHHSEEGVYYHNSETGVTRWSHPTKEDLTRSI
jgi:hypothetical protein